MSVKANSKLPGDWVDRAKNVSILSLAIDYGAVLKPGNRQPTAREHCGPCPVCGGKDRFSVNTHKNVFNCRQCFKGGGPVTMAMHIHGWEWREAVCDIVGEQDPMRADAKPVRKKPIKAAGKRSHKDEDHYRQRARRAAYELFKRGQKFHSLISDYFAVRGLTLDEDILAKFRLVEDLEYTIFNSEKKSYDVIYCGPVILAGIVNDEGRFIGVHRAWIDIDQPKGKAQICHPDTGEFLVTKKVLGSQMGGHIVLRDNGTTNDLIFGEGYESVLSYNDMHNEDDDCALWTAVNLNNLCGRALDRVRHPSRKILMKNGKERVAKVAGPKADLSDYDALILPPRFEMAIHASDFDGDVFETKCKRARALERHSKLGVVFERHVSDRAPAYGMDWNDALMASLKKEGVLGP